MTKLLKIILPLLVVTVGVIGAMTLIMSRPAVETQRPEIPPPIVRVLSVLPRTVELRVSSQGTVVPRTSTQLVSEVSGRVIRVLPAFSDGGFFSKGDLLFVVDERDYEWALTQARSRVSQAELRLAQERASADVAREEWQEIGRGDGTPLALRTLQVEEAQAALDAAQAAVEQAQRDLERTKVRAPFVGRVLNKSIDVGQFVTRGAAVASIYAVDKAEVRLPIPDGDLAFVDLPLGYTDGATGTRARPEVELSTTFGGSRYSWIGRIVRTEGQIDPTSRLVHAIAQVDDPYARSSNSDRPPLAAGMFVEASIRGREYEGIVRLPRVALRETGRVLVVDEEQRLRFRTVEILRVDGDSIYVSAGLATGEKVCISPLETIVEGMRVRAIQEQEETPQGSEGSAS